jgi:hypothetical protein
MARGLALLALVSPCAALKYTYSASILSKAPKPAMSTLNAPGAGYTPCNFTFNPAYLPVGPGVPRSIMVVRASHCPPSYGGAGDHLAWAYCDGVAGTCEDLQPGAGFPFPGGAEDPRMFVLDGWTYLYFYASGPGQNTVFLRRSRTPMDLASWELVASQLPWHRNGCAILRDDGTHYVIFGESPPLPGLGIVTTRDFANYTYLNDKFLVPNGADDAAEPEIVIEAGSTPVQLSTGDYFHLYAAGTPGWVANGNCEDITPARVRAQTERGN